MLAHELRIGNLVEYRIEDEFDSRKEWWAVTAIDSEDINWLEKEAPESTDYRPIPLTEEWLLNFGFDYRFTKGKFNIITKGKLGFENGRTYFNSWAILEKQPDYVHQLQNLYFALTTTELTFKNK